MEHKDVTANASVSPASTHRVLKFNQKTEAAKWNREMLKTLSLALENDSEADLLCALPNVYSKTLALLRENSEYYPALRINQSAQVLAY
jgi:hypothetical protein